MKSKVLVMLVNFIAYSYLIYVLYFKGTTRLNFILGNILIAILAIILLLKFIMYYKTKNRKNSDYDIINEVLKEMEEEKKGR